MNTPYPRRIALLATLLLGACINQAGAADQPGMSALPGSLFPPPACPPNSSCVPGPEPGPAPGTCGPGPGGAPCGGGGPAGLGNRSGTNQGAGNPLNVINGNKYQQEVDMPALPGVLGLELVRHYNSAWHALGQSGYGWRLSYETDLFVVGSTVQLRQADGAELIFNRDPRNPSTCSSANPADGKILINATPRGKEFVWVWPSGRKLAFDHRGKLESITAPTGEFVTLQHGPKGELLKVTDPQGRSLSLQYGRSDGGGFRGIVAIESPLGRFALQHNADAKSPGLGNLVSVTAPQGATRRYHYGADAGEGHPAFAHHLTGISLESTEAKDGDNTASLQRLNTWAYDVNGRGILSVRGLPRHVAPDGTTRPGTGIEQVNLDFKTPGKTVLTNSLGQITTYRHAIVGNSFRLLEVRGAGCASCGDVNVRYGYDKLGRLTEQTALNQLGQPVRTTRTELDGQGRTVRVSAINYLKGKPQAARLLVRYEYAGEGIQPTLVVRPSVILGKEHRTHIVYNRAGQPLSVSESGFSPLDEQGQPLNLAEAKAAATAAAKATPISRSTTHRYSMINGRSVLTQIDGPLANGAKGTPEDSDITVLHYDQRANYLVASVAPGNFQTSYQYDAAGRVVSQALNDGYRQIQSNFGYSEQANIANEPQRIQRSAWLLRDGRPNPDSHQTLHVLQAKFDAQGRRIESTGADGLAKTLSYDAANRPTTLTNAQGQKIHWAYEREGRLLAEVNQDQNGQVVDGRMWLRDEGGRLRAVLDPLGVERIYAYVDDDKSGESQSSQPYGLSRHGDKGQTNPERRRLRDDFGRLVYERHPEDGVVLTHFEVAPGAELQTQVRISTDGELQSNETLRFDAAGRLQSRSRGEPGKDRCTETLRYQGQLLIELEGCGSAQQFERDAFGHITAHSQTLEQGKARYTQRYQYDQNGRLTSRSTSDGQVLRYGYDAETNITQAVSLQRAWLSFLAKITGQDHANQLAAWLPRSWGQDTLHRLPQDKHMDSGLASVQRPTHGYGTRQSRDVAAPRNLPQAIKVSTNAIATTAMLASTTVVTNYPGRTVTAAGRDGFGRQTRHTPASGRNAGDEQILIWNDANQLIAVHSGRSGQAIVAYSYDASGNRIAKAAHGKVTHYLYDTAHRLIAQTDEAGKITRHYLYAAHRVHSILDGGKVYAVQTDWRGLPRSVTDESQKTVWAARFDRWGNKISDSATAPIAVNPQTTYASTGNSLTAFEMPLRLAGQQYDDETGLHYNVHRYYDSAQGRFISPDPLGTPDGNNRYAYLNGNPDAGIDPLGLFEIPAAAFLGNYSIYGARDLGLRDGGHGDILRIAFNQYQRENGFRFSQAIIDQIIINNYHSDANADAGCFGALGGIKGGGQCNPANHFDNPNDGAMYKVVLNADGSRSLGDKYESYTDGKSDNWVMDALNQVDAKRGRYTAVEGRNISEVLSSFGQNSHALADFYAHSNWVDSKAFEDKVVKGKTVREYARGGFFQEKFLIGKDKCGWVPIGLDQSRVWDEAFDSIDMANLFSGTVSTSTTYMCTNPVKGDLTCTSDKTTHGYWNKDDEGGLGGGAEYSTTETDAFRDGGKYFWEVQEYKGKAPDIKGVPADKVMFGVNWYGDPGKTKADLKKGDRIYVRSSITNRHRMAFYLAIEHTKQEIARLYSKAEITMVGSATIPSPGALRLSDVFKMDMATLTVKGIKITDLFSKQ